MKPFVLPPWEFSGATFNSKAHAETRLEIGEKKRNFLLKMHEGVIYFKEPSRGALYAIPQLFAPELAKDPIGLISAWRDAVRVENYGVFVIKRDYFQGLPVRGQFLTIVQSDGGGWMKEHFDTEWFSLPLLEKALDFNVWDDKEVETHMRTILPGVKASLLQRTVSPEVRHAGAPRFVGGDQNQWLLLLAAGARLFLSNSRVNKAASDQKLKSHSAFAKGEFEGFWIKNALREPNFAAFWRTVEAKIAFVGVHWNEGGEREQQYARPRSVRVFNAGIEAWGENWRGNWAPQRGSFSFDLADFGSCSAHEKLEAALQCRDFLRGQTSDKEIEALLQSV